MKAILKQDQTQSNWNVFTQLSQQEMKVVNGGGDLIIRHYYDENGILQVELIIRN